MSLDFNLTGIIVLTGLPGAGKTLYMMQVCEAAVKEGRPVFQCGINEFCYPGVQSWDDPHTWKDLPPRAVLLVDEAQDHFRARAGTRAVPESITDMERIRHSGVCLVLTTQQPTYLDKHLRGLAQHHHLVEILAGVQSNVYRFRSVREDITTAALADAETSLWAHPKRLYPYYKSAEVHTKKLRLPKRIVLLGGGTLLVLGYLIWAFFLRGGDDPKKTQPDGSPAGAFVVDRQRDGERPPLTTLEYAQRMLPRFATLPVSAPIFDDRPAVANPETLCMSSGAGLDAVGTWREASVTCLSEQGTLVDMQQGMARRMARFGPAYNPFKLPTELREGGSGPVRDFQQTGRSASAPLSTTVGGSQISAYGDLGVVNNPQAAPP